MHGAAATGVWRATTAATRCYDELRLLRHALLEVVRPWDGCLEPPTPMPRPASGHGWRRWAGDAHKGRRPALSAGGVNNLLLFWRQVRMDQRFVELRKEKDDRPT